MDDNSRVKTITNLGWPAAKLVGMMVVTMIFGEIRSSFEKIFWPRHAFR